MRRDLLHARLMTNPVTCNLSDPHDILGCCQGNGNYCAGL